MTECFRKHQETVGRTHPDVALFVTLKTPDPGTEVHRITKQLIASM